MAEGDGPKSPGAGAEAEPVAMAADAVQEVWLDLYNHYVISSI